MKSSPKTYTNPNGKTFTFTEPRTLGEIIPKWHLRGRPWRRQRDRARERDNFQCADCGRNFRLEVHHKLPIAEGGTDDLDNLVTLCRDCHIALHRTNNKLALERAEWTNYIR